MQVHAETFKVSGRGSYKAHDGSTRYFDEHSIEVTINGVRREVRCSSAPHGYTCIKGLAVRIPSRATSLPGHATYCFKSGSIRGISTDINKRTVGSCSILGFWETSR